MTDQQQPHADDGIVARPDPGRNAMTGASVDARIRYATLLADSSLVPTAYRGKPANAFLAVETGTMLGVHPIAALNGINVIEGKPTISPGLMTALVRRAGHKVRVSTTGTVVAGDVTAIAEVIRCDDPDFTYRSTWDLGRAERAGLCRVDVDQQGRTLVIARSSTGKALPWESYTEAMLKARAIGEVCREAAEDALSGVHYTPEELGAVVGEDGGVILEGEVVEHPAQQPQAAPAPQADPDPATIAADTPLDDELAPLIREAILDATSRDELAQAWAACEPHQRTRLAATTLADEAGVEIDALALWMRARDAVQAGTAPLRKRDGDVIVDDLPDDDGGDVVDAEIVHDEPTAPRRDQRAERGPVAADADPWATGPQDVKLDDPAPGDYAPGVDTASAVLGGTVVETVAATPAEEAAANRHRPTADHEAVSEDRAERQAEHDPQRAEGAGRAAFLQARAAVAQKASKR